MGTYHVAVTSKDGPDAHWTGQATSAVDAAESAAAILRVSAEARAAGGQLEPGIGLIEHEAPAGFAPETKQARCPEHGRTDCSPLLNGCTRLTSP